MQNPNTFLALAAALLVTGAQLAKADDVPQDETLTFDAAGHAEVNGAPFQKGQQEKPADLYADVAKVIQGPDGSTILYLKPVEARKQKADGKWEKVEVSAEARPFSPEPDWKMFDAEGEVTTDPGFALRVIMPYPMDTAQAMFDVKWNECDGSITGNYTGVPCNRNRGLADEYMEFLKKNFLPCVNAGMSRAGLSAAVKAHIIHDGTNADSNHSGGSLHSAGRAIDIQKVITTDAAGAKNTFDFLKTNTDHRLSKSCAPAGTANCNFYEGFRACWGKLHDARNCPRRSGGPLGTLGWEDKKHIAHHLHTSYPFCPNNRGYFITDKSSR